jgi:hypothetical protein
MGGNARGKGQRDGRGLGRETQERSEGRRQTEVVGRKRWEGGREGGKREGGREGGREREGGGREREGEGGRGV